MGRKMKTIITLFLIILISSNHYSQVMEEWIRTYSGYFGCAAAASVIDDEGNIYITGSGTGSTPLTGSDFYTIKYNSQGFQEWEATYDGEVYDHDWGYAIAIDPLGNVYITGESKGIINGWGSGSDYLTIKYDPQGNELWTQRYHGNNSFTTYNYDRPFAIAVDEQGNVYVTGESVPDGATSGFGDCLTVKYSTTGDLLWTARYGFNQGGYGQDVKVDASGNVYVLGMASGSQSYPDIITLKYNSAGEQQWIKKYSGIGLSPSAMDIDSDHNVYITFRGQTNLSTSGIITVKYNSSGDSLWTSFFESSASFDIAVDALGNVYVTGGAQNALFTGREYVTIKYNSSGQEQWSSRYDGLGDDRNVSFAEAMAIDAIGNVYVTGRSQGADFLQGDYTDFATVKYNNDGVEQWAIRYHRPPNGNEYAIGVHVGIDGSVYVAGAGEVSNNPTELITIKYVQSPSDVEGKIESLNSFLLGQNYPNPFNPSTKIKYTTPSVIASGTKQSQLISLKVYDILGNEVVTLVNKEQPAGAYEVEFNAAGLSSGIYFYRLQAGSFIEIKKMILLR